MPKKKSKSAKTENILLIVKTGDDYYAAGSAWKLPAAFADDLDAFKPKRGVPVTLSDRALVMKVDKAEVRPMEWIAQNLNPPPKPLPR